MQDVTVHLIGNEARGELVEAGWLLQTAGFQMRGHGGYRENQKARGARN